MLKIKFSQNWNNKLLLNSYFSTIRIFSNNNHVVGSLVKCEYTRKGEKVEFVCEIASISTSKLDQIPECMFFLDTGYNKESSIKMFENMYKNSGIDIHSTKFCILVLKHRPDIEQRAMQATSAISQHCDMYK